MIFRFFYGTPKKKLKCWENTTTQKIASAGARKKPLDAKKKKRKALEIKGGRSFSNMYKILVRTIFFSQREKNSFFL